MSGVRLMTVVALAACAWSFGASGCSSSTGSHSGHASSGAPPIVPQPVLEESDTPFRVRLSWTVPNGAKLDGFEISRDGQVVARLPATASRYVDRDVAARGHYVYSIEATIGSRRSQPAAAEATLPTPPLADARLTGNFDVRITISGASGYGNDVPTFTAGWRFRPTCEAGACDVIWSDNASRSVHARASRHGGIYRISYHGFYFISCSGTHATSSLDITLHVTKARVRHGEWVASHVRGTYDQSEAEQLGCVASHASGRAAGHAVTG
jgi:hypothetical protein